MSKPTRMLEVTVAIPQSYQDTILSILQEQGIFHPNVRSNDASDSQTYTSLLKLRETVQQLHDKIQHNTNSQDSTRVRTPLLQAETLSSLHDQSQTLLKQLNDIEQQIEENKMQDTRLALLERLSTVFAKGKYTPLTGQLNEIAGTIDPKAKITEYVDELSTLVQTIQYTDDTSLVYAVSLQQEQLRLIKAQPSFEEIELPHTTTTLKTLHKERDMLTNKRKQLQQHYHTISKNVGSTLPFVQQMIDDAIDGMRATHALTRQPHHVILTGWVPEKEMHQFATLLDSQTNNSYLILSKQPVDDAPVQMNNRAYTRPFELLTRLYALPKYNGVDPTALLAITFPLIFGLMFTDVFYGFLLLVAAIALPRLTTPTKGVRQFSNILVVGAITTMIFGVLAGSYFGNALEGTTSIQALQLVNPMTDILPLILLSSAIGVVHVTLGLAMGFTDTLRQGSFKVAMEEQGGWLIVVLGVLALITGYFYTSWLQHVGLYILLFGMIVRAGFAYVAQGTMGGILSIFDISKFAGDIASYVRIMALAIGTTGIALAVNVMAEITATLPVVGVFLAVLVFIIGHVFNMLINGLGAFVHTLRLHFLEHFSKYYEGGGTEYEPVRKRSSYQLHLDEH